MGQALVAAARAGGHTVAAGVERRRLLIDPGFGFGKTKAQNLEAVRRLRELTVLGCPILLGVSRKSTFGAVTGQKIPAERVVAVTGDQRPRIGHALEPTGRIVGVAGHQHRIGTAGHARRPGVRTAAVGADVDFGDLAIGSVEVGSRVVDAGADAAGRRTQRTGAGGVVETLAEDRLEPAAGEQIAIEQPTRIESRPWDYSDVDDRIRGYLGLTTDDPIRGQGGHSWTAFLEHYAMVTEAKTQVVLGSMYPAISEWVCHHGTIEIGSTGTAMVSARLMDSDGVLFETVHAKTLADLRQRLRAWQTETNDPWTIVYREENPKFNK